jgi:hypothetical protein
VNDEEPQVTQESVTPSMIADQFVASEIAKTRSALKQTQIAGTIIFLFVFFYIGGIAMKFHRSLQPDEAATIAKGFVAQRVDEGAPQITDYLKREIPTVIEKAPDYVKQQLPQYRTQLEDRLEQEFKKYTDDTSTQLSNELDKFLADNKDQFKTLILNGQDPQAAQQMAANLRQLFITYLAEKSDGGESIQDKLDQSLEALGKIKAMTTKLAAGKNLNDTEKKTRQAIAVLLTTIDQKQAEDPLPTKDQIVDAGKDAYGQDAAQVNSAVSGSQSTDNQPTGKAAPTHQTSKAAHAKSAGKPTNSLNASKSVKSANAQ